MRANHIAYENVVVMNPAERTVIARQLRELAAAERVESEESFERCDTDGFLTQAVKTVYAELFLKRASLLEGDLRAEFLMPSDLTGTVLRHRVCNTAYGTKWKIGDEWVDPYVKRPETLRRKGYRRLLVRGPAWARLRSAGKGIQVAHVEVSYAGSDYDDLEILGEVLGWEMDENDMITGPILEPLQEAK